MRKIALLLLFASPVLAAPRGQGGVVIRDDAPVYAESKGDKVEWRLKQGESVSGYLRSWPHSVSYQFEEKDGRVPVAYLRNPAGSGEHHGWMDPKDLARFTFEGSCGFGDTPYSVKGFGKFQWNVCFQEARDNKLEALRATWATAAAPSPAPATTPAEPATK